MAQTYSANKASRDAAVARWRAKNPDKARAISKRSYNRHVEIQRLRTILRKRSITLDQYHSLLESQDFQCYLCDSDGLLQLDHHHKTGRVRRLLCRPCNIGIGYFKENPVLLHKAAHYLERYSNDRVGY